MKNYMTDKEKYYIITAGSTYLDIDAYACCVAMAELLKLKGKNALAYSCAPRNSSVCDFLVTKGEISRKLPQDVPEENLCYIIVDVSDPGFLKSSVPLHKVTEIYDHHVGFEKFWEDRIGDGAHIEFIGAAATLIYREWKKAGLQDKISRSAALLLIAAILDNTLNLTSSNTTDEDIEAFGELCRKEGINEKWCARYFSDVQSTVECDLKSALLGDIKTLTDNPVLPKRIAQISVWDTERIIARLDDIRPLFDEEADSWMINIIDIRQRCSYFVCDSKQHQKEIERVFGVSFDSGVAKTAVSYLRKEIIKKTITK